MFLLYFRRIHAHSQLSIHFVQVCVHNGAKKTFLRRKMNQSQVVNDTEERILLFSRHELDYSVKRNNSHLTMSRFHYFSKYDIAYLCGPLVKVELIIYVGIVATRSGL